MLTADPSPSAWRIIAAFLAAPTSASVLCAWLADGRIDGWALYAMFGAFPTMIVFGLPAFFFLRSRLVELRPTALNCAIVGAAVAAAPWCLFFLLLVVFSPGPEWEAVLLVGKVTLSGAIGGVVFWLVAAARRTQEPLKAPSE